MSKIILSADDRKLLLDAMGLKNEKVYYCDVCKELINITRDINNHVVKTFCGQGYHEDPQVLHYGRKGEGVKLLEGMIFTIEPMINAGKRHTKLLNDGWTVVTKDHSLSAQWEHMVAVTKDGYEILTPWP